jgi:hypothetical protein
MSSIIMAACAQRSLSLGRIHRLDSCMQLSRRIWSRTARKLELAGSHTSLARVPRIRCSPVRWPISSAGWPSSALASCSVTVRSQLTLSVLIHHQKRKADLAGNCLFVQMHTATGCDRTWSSSSPAPTTQPCFSGRRNATISYPISSCMHRAVAIRNPQTRGQKRIENSDRDPSSLCRS